VKLLYAPEGRLRMTLDDRSYLDVTPHWVSPRTYPDRYLSLVDGKGHEICLLSTIEEAGPENEEILRNELGRRYLYTRVTAVEEIRMVFGSTYWTVQTERGRREFVTQSLQENANWISPDFLHLVDVEGNHYHVRPVSELDARSQRLIHGTV